MEQSARDKFYERIETAPLAARDKFSGDNQFLDNSIMKR